MTRTEALARTLTTYEEAVMTSVCKMVKEEAQAIIKNWILLHPKGMAKRAKTGDAAGAVAYELTMRGLGIWSPAL